MSGASGPRTIPPLLGEERLESHGVTTCFFGRPKQLLNSVSVIPRIPRLDDRRERFYTVDNADPAHSGF